MKTAQRRTQSTHKREQMEDEEEEKEEKDEEEEYDPDKNGSGPIKDRSCTDVICLGLLVGFIVLWIMIAVWINHQH